MTFGQSALAMGFRINPTMRKGVRQSAPIPKRRTAIVAGSVAVTSTGKRCGKGEGYSDIEFAILRELGHQPVPVATTVHSIQIVDDFPRDEIDLPLSVIVTPDKLINVDNPFPAPEGIAWDRLSEQDIVNMPVLRDLQVLQTQ